MTPAEEAEVRPERVAAVLGQTPLAVAVTAANAGLMTAISPAAGPGPRELAWLVAILAVGLLRLALWRAHRADPEAARHARRWGSLAAGASVAAGLLWGGGAAFLWPEAEARQLFWVFVVGGMCAGAASLHVAHLPTALGFILPAGLPVAAVFAAEGSMRGEAAAAMIVIFVIALGVTCRRASRLFGEHVLLRLAAGRQARALDAANARLRHEIEEHRATGETLRQAQKMEALGQLTGGIAHDFNNLLMAVTGSLALLRKRLPAGDARAGRLLENAIEGANRGTLLTQRLLAFARRQALRPAPVALPALVDGMADLLRRSLGPGHRLETGFPEDLPPVLVDANQLELALLNLVVNARDAMPGGGAIRLGAFAAEEVDADGAPRRFVALTVRDTGVGMDAATLARATEPFFTTKGQGQGTGLGLSMVHGLAAQSGGRLVLRSRAGEGTVAELFLPRAAMPPPASAPPPAEAREPAPLRPRPLNILVVDDDPLVLASTAAMVEDLGHAAIEAPGAAEALDCLRAGEAAVDLVITDVVMPGMGGLALAAILRGLRPGLPVVLATGLGDLPEAGAAGHEQLRKPFGTAELAAMIGEASGRAVPSDRRPDGAAAPA